MQQTTRSEYGPPKTLKVVCQQVVVFISNEIGVFDGVDNIGLGVNVDQLVSVDPISAKELELHVHVPTGYEIDELVSNLKPEVY